MSADNCVMNVKLDDVYYTYPDGGEVLNGVTLTLEVGEQVALIGQNGSGKTTLAKHLNGLLRPQRGEVWIGDWLTSSCSISRLAHRVAYVFQNPDEQSFRQRVWDEVAFGPQNLGYNSARVKTLVAEALSWVGLEEYSGINPRDQGYSSRKRVALAGALAMDTPVMVFDEPTSGLDAQELNMLAQILSSLRERNKTVLVISHDLDFVAENLGRVVLMDRGCVVADYSTQEFFQNASCQSSSLQPPQIVRLSQQLGQAETALTVEQFLDKLSNSVGLSSS
jgi:energy-coupling factor transport system ATP-binding protein